MTDQNRTPASHHSEQAAAEEAKEPLAVRRIKKLRKNYPEASPAELAEQVEKIFVRDFTWIGGTESGVKSVLPGAFTAATSRGKLAAATQAAGHLGLMQGVSNYAQKAARGVETSAHVGFSQSIKTYAHAFALLAGREVGDAEDATTQILGADVHQLLLTMNQPIAYEEGQRGASPVNVVAAISTIGMRNPQILLLVKSGEQLVKSGGSVMTSAKAHREFAQQIISLVRSNVGDFPQEFPAEFALPAEGERVESGTPVATDAAEIEATDAREVEATSAEELDRIAAQNTYQVQGAKLAAKAFLKGSEKFKAWGRR